MNTAITISFSIHYHTYYGQELQLNLDESTCRKLTWTPGDIWMGTITIIRPRTIKWWYSVTYNNEIQRIEEIPLPRDYVIDHHHTYYHIYDRWGNPMSSVSPLIMKEEKKSHSCDIFIPKAQKRMITDDDDSIDQIIANATITPKEILLSITNNAPTIHTQTYPKLPIKFIIDGISPDKN